MSSLLRSLGQSIAASGRVVNCVDLRDNRTLDFLFPDQGPQLNTLAIASDQPEPCLPWQILCQVPTGWARLCIFDVERLPDLGWQESLEDAIRLTAKDGIILLCATEEQRNKFLELASSLSGTWGDYGSSFGIEKISSPWSYVAWYRRNQHYLLGPGHGGPETRVILEHQLSMTRELVCSMRHELAVLRSRFANELSEVSGDRQKRKQLEADLAAKHEEISALTATADELRQALHQQEACLRDKDFALHNAEATLTRLEREKISLQRELNDITNSFKQSQDTLHRILESKFWRTTSFPRKVLDRLKGMINADRNDIQTLIEPPARPESDRISSGDHQDSHVQVNDDCTSHQSAHEVPGSSESFAEWTGTFLNLDDHSVRSAPRRGERCLFVDWRLPEPDKDSGSYRIHQILSIVSNYPGGIDFIGDSEIAEPRYVDQLIDLGINVILGRDAGVKYLRKFGARYRSIILSRPKIAAFYIPLARCYAPRAKIIYDTVDLHYVRFRRGAELCQHDVQESTRLQRLSNQYKTGELYMSSVVDSVVVVTDVEKSLLSERIESTRIEVIPNIHSVETAKETPDFSARSGLLFVGGFDHSPNVDAVLYFCKEVMPLLRQCLPNVVLHVVGSNMPAAIHELKSDNIDPVGYVSDLDDYFNAVRLFVAPLRYGAGLKGKVGQSMSYGVPVIGTSIAFEGFDAEHRKHAMIADSPQAFVDSLTEAYTNPTLWCSLSSNAKHLVDAKFSPQIVASRLHSLVWNVEGEG